MNNEKYTGNLNIDNLLQCPGMPSKERLEKGAVVCVECDQDIPCNPCEKACPNGAIPIGYPITNLPKLDEEKCNGCGICIAACPGLAIFKVHKNYTEKNALVGFPFEYYPLPDKGDEVPCANRAGDYVVMGKVFSVLNPKKFNGTPVITVEIPKEYCLEVRTICRKEVK
ncbi:MAG: 4Fe-4S ferredoxin [bacterium]|nr:4Fe-4S ferredoxin [bacterium]